MQGGAGKLAKRKVFLLRVLSLFWRECLFIRICLLSLAIDFWLFFEYFISCVFSSLLFPFPFLFLLLRSRRRGDSKVCMGLRGADGTHVTSAINHVQSQIWDSLGFVLPTDLVQERTPSSPSRSTSRQERKYERNLQQNNILNPTISYPSHFFLTNHTQTIKKATTYNTITVEGWD